MSRLRSVLFPSLPEGLLLAVNILNVLLWSVFVVAFIGIITASVATWFVQRTQKNEGDVMTELREIRVQLAALAPTTDPANPAQSDEAPKS